MGLLFLLLLLSSSLLLLLLRLLLLLSSSLLLLWLLLLLLWFLVLCCVVTVVVDPLGTPPSPSPASAMLRVADTMVYRSWKVVRLAFLAGRDSNTNMYGQDVALPVALQDHRSLSFNSRALLT